MEPGTPDDKAAVPSVGEKVSRATQDLLEEYSTRALKAEALLETERAEHADRVSALEEQLRERTQEIESLKEELGSSAAQLLRVKRRLNIVTGGDLVKSASSNSLSGLQSGGARSSSDFVDDGIYDERALSSTSSLFKPRWSDIVRKNRFIALKVSEVKDLLKQKGGLSELWESQSVYCIIAMDNEEVARTKKVSTKLNLWNEDFTLDLPVTFEKLTISVCIKGTVKAMFKDDVLAQLTLRKETITKDGLKHEDWWPLFRPRRVEQESSGAVQLALSVTPGADPTSSVLVTVRVLSARNLGHLSDDDAASPCESFVVMHILPDEEGATQQKTRVLADSNSPSFNETFYFTVTPQQVADGRLHIGVWDAMTRKSNKEPEFIGHVGIPLVIISQAADSAEQWYALSSKINESASPSASSRLAHGARMIKRATSSMRLLDKGELTRSKWSPASLVKAMSLSEPGSGNSSHEFSSVKLLEDSVDCDQCSSKLGAVYSRCKSCGLVSHEACLPFLSNECTAAGSIRLSFKYTQEYLLPYGAYNNLLHILSDDRTAILVSLATISDADRLNDFSRSAVNIFHSQGSATRFICQVITEEVNATKDPNNIFRGNSLASKAIDYYMRLIGSDYLASVLKKIIADIYTEHKLCEQDMSKIEATRRGSVDVLANRRNLLTYVKRTLDSIFTSLDRCPQPLRDIFAHMQAEVIRKFPTEPLIRYIVVSGFIFLRFFNPAILGPKLFGLRDELPDVLVGRTLTLVAKVIMNVASLCEFGQKEPYMIDLNPFIEEKKPAMMQFIDALSNNLEGTMQRLREVEERIKVETRIIEGMENLSKAQKSAHVDKKGRDQVRKQHADASDKISDLRKEFDTLRRIVDQMNSGATDRTEYAKKSNVDVDLELSRLYYHVSVKKSDLLALLEASSDPVYQHAGRCLAVAISELDDMRERFAVPATQSSSRSNLA